MKILILYASFGGGHFKAAEALKEHYEQTHTDYEVMFLDALKYTSPELNKFILKSYVQLAKNMPKAWEKLYDLSDQYSSLTDITSLLNKIVAKKFLSLVTEFNPDIIICTHPFAIDMLTLLKKKEKLQSKIGLVLTDYAPHSLWLTQPDTVDAFFVATDIMQKQLQLDLVAKSKIYPTGIPTLSAFSATHDKEAILKELDLDSNVFTILFFPGGEYGLTKNGELFKDILRIPNIQIITIAGKNEKLKNQFERLSNLSTKKIRVLGYTDKIPELLSISDMVITKPGGLTTTESIVSNVPIVITSPVPGQEEHNSNYILNNGLGFRLFDNTDKLLNLKSFISNKKRLEQIKEMQKIMAKPHAAQEICDIMESLLEK